MTKLARDSMPPDTHNLLMDKPELAAGFAVCASGAVTRAQRHLVKQTLTPGSPMCRRARHFGRRRVPARSLRLGELGAFPCVKALALSDSMSRRANVVCAIGCHPARRSQAGCLGQGPPLDAYCRTGAGARPPLDPDALFRISCFKPSRARLRCTGEAGADTRTRWRLRQVMPKSTQVHLS